MKNVLGYPDQTGVTQNNKLKALSRMITADNPRIFWIDWIDFNGWLRYNTESGYYKEPSWPEGGSTDISYYKTTFLDGIQKAVNAIKATLPENASSYEKIMAIAEWLCDNNTYNYEQTSSHRLDSNPVAFAFLAAHSAYSAMIPGDAFEPVCEGYAAAFAVLCEEFGINAICVSGTFDNGNHMWNYVELDGKWYLVDVTNMDNDHKDSDGSEANYRYNFLLLGTKAALAERYSNDPYLGSGITDENDGFSFTFPALAEGPYYVAPPTFEETDVYGGKLVTVSGSNLSVEADKLTLYYTTDGTSPTTDSSKVSETFTSYPGNTIEKEFWLTETTTVKSMLCASGNALYYSAPASFEVNLTKAPAPTITTNGTKAAISVSDDSWDTRIYYTTDGTNPSFTIDENGKENIKGNLYNSNGLELEIGTEIRTIAVRKGYAVSEVASAEVTGETSELIKLPTPTELTWGKDPINLDGEVQFEEVPGVYTWKSSERIEFAGQGLVEVIVYKKGEEEPVYRTRNGAAYIDDAYSNHNWSFLFNDPTSGTYYFTVQFQGDGIKYSDSDVATSEEWVYTAPEEQLPTPEIFGWKWPEMTIALSQSEEQVYARQFEFYFAKTQDEIPQYITSLIIFRQPTGNYVTGTILDYVISQCGLGYYYYRARLVSNNIEVIRSGEWSELSEAYDLTEVYQGTKNKLNEIDQSSSSEAIKKAVRDIGTLNLKTAMEADQGGPDGVVDLLSKLEEKAAGGGAKVVPTEDMNYFNKSDVRVVGANLNMEKGKSATLIVDEPRQEHNIPAIYDHTLTVQFDLHLKVNDERYEGALKVPIQVTLPIPDTIKDPGKLVILHYRTDGVTETIQPYVYEENGKWFASFVLDHFSDFAMVVLSEQQSLPGGLPPVLFPAVKLPGSVLNGRVTANVKNALAGQKVTLTVVPEKGYQLSELKVLDASGASVSVKSSGNGKYTFTMPKRDVKVSAAFVKAPVPYTDVDQGAWYGDSVWFVHYHDLMAGVGNSLFDPYGIVTRAQVVQTLWNCAGSPRVEDAIPFSDVSEGKWYTEAVRWAAREGVIFGYGDGTFAPDKPVSREDLMAMLYRYEVKRHGQASVKPDKVNFADAGKVAAWAVDAVAWGVENGIISGKDNNLFDPTGLALRSELAAVLTRYQA